MRLCDGTHPIKNTTQTLFGLLNFQQPVFTYHHAK
jgi:hypothetical protein